MRNCKRQGGAPFPYFGGKARVAAEVWAALGEPHHYLDPFFGSGAVLLARPQPSAAGIETVCDADGYLCNVWRALRADPDTVAQWCDWPVNHADLSARKRRLLRERDQLLRHLTADDDWCDPKLAGYWIWAASCWIGDGLTETGGMGVPSLGKTPHIAGSGKGVHSRGTRVADDATVPRVQDPYNVEIYRWFRQLSERLRYVRVVCGDWSRICGGHWHDAGGLAGIFFDPPYGVEDRQLVYGDTDCRQVAAAVRAWCLARGDRPSYRIVLAGYEPEHNESPGARLDAGRLERVRRVWQPGPRAHEPPSRAALPLAPLQSAG